MACAYTQYNIILLKTKEIVLLLLLPRKYTHNDILLLYDCNRILGSFEKKKKNIRQKRDERFILQRKRLEIRLRLY